MHVSVDMVKFPVERHLFSLYERLLRYQYHFGTDRVKAVSFMTW